jgi:hypothetical protein
MRHLSNRGMTTAAVITAISQSGTMREKLAVIDLSLPALMYSNLSLLEMLPLQPLKR